MGDCFLTTTDQLSCLVVGSDDNLRRLEATYLVEMGYKSIYHASNGAEAWYTLKNQSIGLVVSAWDLPDMSGLVLLRFFRADSSFSDLPVLLIGKKITKTQVIEAGEAGVSGIMTHPFTDQAFKTKISKMLRVAEEDSSDVEYKVGYDRGLEYMRKGRFEEALSQFKQLLTLYESAEIYYNMGYIKTAQGRFEEALLAFRRATQINSAFAKAYQKMGEVYAKLGRKDEAQSCLEKAAEIYLEKQMDDNAESALLEALKINPNTINVYNTLGIVYRRQSKYQEAIRYYRKALRVTPEDENIHFNLARVYMEVKEFREARRVLERAVELNPEFEEARTLLKSLEMGAGLT